MYMMHSIKCVEEGGKDFGCAADELTPQACYRFDLFAPAHPGKPHRLHQPGGHASGHADVLPEQLTPDLANAIYTEPNLHHFDGLDLPFL